MNSLNHTPILPQQTTQGSQAPQQPVIKKQTVPIFWKDDINHDIDKYTIECETLYDCESEMSVSDNNGYSTIEVSNNDDEVIWRNGN